MENQCSSNVGTTRVKLWFLMFGGCLLLNAYLPVIGQEVNISSGAYLNYTGAIYININNADFVNNGNYTKGAETITFSGNTAKTISGTSNTDMHNLLVTNTGGITTLLEQLTASNLTINLGSKFTINPAKNVMVSGVLTNSADTADFLLKSDATGTAALIHNTDNVLATVQRYITGAAEDWHFLSSPVANQPISGTWLPPGTYGNGTGYDLYLWNEPNNCWIYNLDNTSAINWNTVHPGANFMAGRGYLYSLQALNPTKEFAGNLNNGILSYGLTTSSTDVGLKGFNLIGNPYASSVDWQAALGWLRSNLVESGDGYDMWIWNPAANNYGVSNSYTGISTNGVTQYIAPMQGFFVQAASAGNLSMDNNIRTFLGANDWLKSSMKNSKSISVSVISEAGYGSDETMIGFGYSKNENGAIKLFSRVPTAPSLYMVLGSYYFSVRYLSNTQDNPAIPLSFKPGANGKFTLSCSFEQNSFETVVLEDRKEKSFHDMKVNSTYSFWSSNFDAANRFVLHLGPVENSPEYIFPAKIYTDGHYLIIDLTLVSNKTEALVHDTMGRLLLNKKLQGKTLHKLNLNANPQIVIVSLRSPDGRLSQKLYWQ